MRNGTTCELSSFIIDDYLLNMDGRTRRCHLGFFVYTHHRDTEERTVQKKRTETNFEYTFFLSGNKLKKQPFYLQTQLCITGIVRGM